MLLDYIEKTSATSTLTQGYYNPKPQRLLSLNEGPNNEITPMVKEGQIYEQSVDAT